MDTNPDKHLQTLKQCLESWKKSKNFLDIVETADLYLKSSNKMIATGLHTMAFPATQSLDK
ncbi:hypothetical protein KIN20_026218 [Parelaphostrongylus tenuis]|uniref:Uncharacterized protein n=1 Tax=Parelaphostrongylus tenuis TaxID=148309 RepID=A0AAD5QXC3_PARTN|nr:hypothetical protein KIN20_026218 [Parelaphostrongylus tenuis]